MVREVPEMKQNCKYPIEELSKYIGKYLRVLWVDCDKPKDLLGKLVYEPTNNGLYIGEKEHYGLVHWDWTTPGGFRSYIISISDDKDNLIWKRDD